MVLNELNELVTKTNTLSHHVTPSTGPNLRNVLEPRRSSSREIREQLDRTKAAHAEAKAADKAAFGGVFG